MGFFMNADEKTQEALKKHHLENISEEYAEAWSF